MSDLPVPAEDPTLLVSRFSSHLDYHSETMADYDKELDGDREKSGKSKASSKRWFLLSLPSRCILTPSTTRERFVPCALQILQSRRMHCGLILPLLS